MPGSYGASKKFSVRGFRHLLLRRNILKRPNALPPPPRPRARTEGRKKKRNKAASARAFSFSLRRAERAPGPRGRRSARTAPGPARLRAPHTCPAPPTSGGPEHPRFRSAPFRSVPFRAAHTLSPAARPPFPARCLPRRGCPAPALPPPLPAHLRGWPRPSAACGAGTPGKSHSQVAAERARQHLQPITLQRQRLLNEAPS